MFTLFKKKEKRVYLDHAGGAPVSLLARQALRENIFLFGNPSAIHKEGDQASRLLTSARNKIATTINAHSYEVYFTSSGTESCNLAIYGTIAAWKKSNSGTPHVIVSAIEHPAVLEPVRALEKEGQVSVTYVPVNEEGYVKVTDVEKALQENTALVCVMYINNEIGTIQPVKEIGKALDEWKTKQERVYTSFPYFHVDACQAVNYVNLDIVRLKAHLMTINSTKAYGPKGIAALYKREGCTLVPVTLGGGQERGLRSGTPSATLAYAFAVALEEAQKIKEEESKRLRFLRDFCRDEILKEIPEAIIYGGWDKYDGRKGFEDKLRTEGRVPNNINCGLPGIASEEMILRLDTKGFAVSHKSACASQESDGSYVIEALGGTRQEALENIRITLGRDTQKKDILHFVKTLKEIYYSFRKHSTN